MAQTTVTNFATPGFVGYLAEQRASDVLKGGPVYQDQTISLGLGVVLDPALDFAVMLPSATSGEVFAGVTYNAFTKPSQLTNNPGPIEFQKGDSATYCARGVIFVAPETNITVGEPVYLRVLADGPLSPGHFRNDASGGDAILLPNARWLTSALAGEPCKLEINTP
jgi:hypothetical protein